MPSSSAAGQQIAFDHNVGLWYRWDDELQRTVYLDRDTGAPIRRRSEHEEDAVRQLREHQRNRSHTGGSSSEQTPLDSITDGVNNFSLGYGDGGRDEEEEEEDAEEDTYTTDVPTPAAEPRQISNELACEVFYGPKDAVTDQELLREGHEARARATARTTAGTNLPKRDRDRLDPNFRIQPNPSKFFVVGRVIKVLWPELGGYQIDNLTFVTAVNNRFKDEKVFLKIRWFVVIKEGAQWCTCLPIATYRGQGVAKPSLLKWQHSIIYTGRKEPAAGPNERPGPGEHGMRLAIRVEPSSNQYTMDPLSRLHYAKIYTIEHNVKVFDFGMVRPEYLQTLKTQWKDVMDWSIQGPRDSHSSIPGGTQIQGSSNVFFQGSSDTMGAYRGTSNAPSNHLGTTIGSYGYGNAATLDPVPETQREVPPPHFINYAVVRKNYEPSDDDPAKDQQIAIKKKQRLGIIQMYDSGWRKVWNQDTDETGLVWKDYIILDTEE